MNWRSLLRVRFCLPLGAVALVGVFALGQGPSVQPQSDVGAVWVYFTSLCAKAGDASDCAEVKTETRPSFGSLEACSLHRDQDLSKNSNPRLLGSCLRQREA